MIWTDAAVSYLVEHYPNQPTEKIAQHLRRPLSSVYNKAASMELKKSEEYLSSPLSGRLSKDHQRGGVTRFKKGQPAWNKGMKGLDLSGGKGQFQKGNKPHNTKKDGDRSIRKDKNGISYVHVRVAKGKWVHEHRLLWEAENGPIPKGMMLRCRDGDQTNTAPSNWYPVNRAEHARLNHNPEKAYLNGPFHNLSDNYVATMITMKEPHLKEEVKKQPELLEVARLNMKLKRELKKQAQ